MIVCVCVCARAHARARTQSCPNLYNPMDLSQLDSCPWNFPGKILELAAISFSRGSSWPRDWICISGVSCIGRWILYCWTAWEALCLPDFYLILIIHVIPYPSTLCLLRRPIYYLHTKIILWLNNMIYNS